jgi:hypothetical protein
MFAPCNIYNILVGCCVLVLAYRGISGEQDLRLVRGTKRQELVLWEVRMCFYLVHGRHDARVLEERGQGFDAKIGDADIFDFSYNDFSLFGSGLNVVD